MKIIFPVQEIDVLNVLRVHYGEKSDIFLKIKNRILSKVKMKVFKINNLGISLTREYFSGERLQTFQKRLNCFCNVNPKKGEVKVSCVDDIEDKIHDYLQFARKKLKEEISMRVLEGDVRAYFGNGGKIEGILLHHEYDSLFIRLGDFKRYEDWIKRDDLRKTLSSFGKIRDIQIKPPKGNYQFQIIRVWYQSKNEAQVAYNQLIENPQKYFKGKVYINRNNLCERNSSSRVVVKYFTNISSSKVGFGILNFSSHSEQLNFIKSAKLLKVSGSDKAKVTYSRSGRFRNVYKKTPIFTISSSNPLNLHTIKVGTKMNNFAVSFSFSTDINELDVSNWLKKDLDISIQFGKIFLPKSDEKPEHKTLKVDEIEKIFSKYGDLLSVNLSKSEKKQLRTVYLQYKTEEGAKRCVQKFLFKSTNKVEGYPQEFYVDYDKSVLQNIEEKYCEILKDDLLEYVTKIREKYGNKIRIKQFTKSKIWIFSEQEALKILISNQIKKMFTGMKLSLKNLFVLTDFKEGRDFVNLLRVFENVIIHEKESKYFDPESQHNKKDLYLISPKNKRKRIIQKLREFIKKFVGESKNWKKIVIKVTSKLKNKNFFELIENFVKKEGISIQSKIIEKNEEKEYKFFVSGNRSIVKELEKKVKEFQKRKELEQSWKGNITQKSCKICYDQIERPFILSSCGCLFCFNCIKNLLKYLIIGKIFPICCPDPKCREKIVIRDLFRILEEKEITSLFRSSFRNFKNENSNIYKPCPTPDCPALFISDGLDDVFDCRTCKNQYCRKCKKEAHYGLTCIELKVKSEKLSDEELSVLGIKKCPKCRNGIEKNEGCNHIACMCGVHICWRCMKFFNTSQDCYHHLNSAHDGVFDYN